MGKENLFGFVEFLVYVVTWSQIALLESKAC